MLRHKINFPYIYSKSFAVVILQLKNRNSVFLEELFQNQKGVKCETNDCCLHREFILHILDKDEIKDAFKSYSLLFFKHLFVQGIFNLKSKRIQISKIIFTINIVFHNSITLNVILKKI